jgi:hypothetical protein
MTAPDYFTPSIKPIYSVLFGKMSGFEVAILTIGSHSYPFGMIARLRIPPEFGAQQLDGIYGQVIPYSATQIVFVTNIPVRDQFIPNPNPVASWSSVPLVIPMGESVPEGTADVFYNATQNNNNITPEIYPPAPYPAVR